MNKIKIVGVLIFVLSLILALLFNYTFNQNKINIDALSTINEQKSYTQEISKSILYLYKNRGGSTEQLDNNIEKFLVNMSYDKEHSPEHDALVKLWNDFYVAVQRFREKQNVTTAYGTIIVDSLVNDIYNKNQKLIVEFNRFISFKQKQYDETIDSYKNIEYILYFMVVLLLVYLFTQLRGILSFIQKFSKTSKTIIQSATIEGLKPIEVRENHQDLKEASQNFNYLVDKINTSIAYSNKSIEHTIEAIEKVEYHIEDFISLLSKMQNQENNALSQKEDAVIESLETLMNLTDRLADLNKDLDQLISSQNNH